jgi:DNA (cytosine-5)-methyltransferase 1
MKLGSLFDGIAGFPYAASLEGITPVWASEIAIPPVRWIMRQIRRAIEDDE